MLNLIRRIAAMRPDEIRTRLGVLVRQRVDAWHATRGRNPLDPGLVSVSESRPSFFFDAGSQYDLAAEVRRRLPHEAAGVIESATRIDRGSFDLLGYRELSFGSEKIDWSLDPVHGKRAPHLPWFRVPYLDFNTVGDHKIVWELSRHQHLMLLARAWLYSGDARFLRKLEELWRDWRAANPYPIGINWTSALEAAFRCMSWIWVDHWISGASEASDDFRGALKQGIGESATYIRAYISTYFAPNTHLLGEALALFLAGLLYPEFRPAAEWRDYGWKIVVQESERQVHPDGFHFEQSVYYHVYALEMFLYARILAARNGIPVPEAYDSALIRMADGLATIGGAGQPPRFGDDDGGRLFDGRRNRTEHLLDPLASVAAVYGRADWKALAGDLREETIWILGAQGVHAFDTLQPEPRRPQSRAFSASGYYVLASRDSVAVVDAGPHGWGRGGHGHADALSLQLIAGGRAWLTDPGTCSYPMEKPDRNRFRGTSAHNTLEVDGLSQAEPFHSFGWRSMPNVKRELWCAGRAVTIFRGSHYGYTRLPTPVAHARDVLSWPDGMWLVRDVIGGTGEHSFAIRWHLVPECMLTQENASNWRAVTGEDVLHLSIASAHSWAGHCERSQWSPCYGVAVDAPVLRLTSSATPPAECATLLLYNQAAADFQSVAGDNAIAYLCRIQHTIRLVLFAVSPGRWSFEALTGEGEICGIEFGEGEMTSAFTVQDGELLEWTAGDAAEPPFSAEALSSIRLAHIG